MQINELSFAEASRMRNRLTRVYARVGMDVDMDLWIETQNELMKMRSRAGTEAKRTDKAPSGT